MLGKIIPFVVYVLVLVVFLFLPWVCIFKGGGTSYSNVLVSPFVLLSFGQSYYIRTCVVFVFISVVLNSSKSINFIPILLLPSNITLSSFQLLLK